MKKTTPKILQISNFFLPNIGGIEQVAKNIAAALSGEQVEQRIICFNEDAEGGGIVCRRGETTHEVIDGVSVTRCGCIAKIASQSVSLTYKRELFRELDEFKPDIVILHYPNPFVSSILLSYTKRSFKLVVWWHLDITKQKQLKKLFHKQNLKLIERADLVVGTSDIYLKHSEYAKQFDGKCVAIPNCVIESRLALTDEDKSRVEEIRHRYAGKTICFFAGRHVPYKGLTYLVDASRQISRNDIVFIIAGGGDLTEQLKQQAAGDGKIEFVGKLGESDYKAHLAACDIFTFPSITKNEAFGLSLAEAMYFGKPAVTFTIPGSGVNYVSLNGVTGIECPNSDSKALADAIVKLADDKELREEYGRNARQRVLEHFTFEAFRRRTAGLLV